MISKEEKKEINKLYYKKNRNKLLESAKKKIKCKICGQLYTRNNKKHHEESSKQHKIMKEIKDSIIKLNI